jgi:hypothetical protein
MKINKKQKFILVSLIICIIFFLLPFLLFGNCESFYSKLSLAFSTLGSISTLITLIIAIKLFDRFGIEAKFAEKQFDKVIDLIELLKGKQIFIESNKFKYFIQPSQKQFQELKTLEQYLIDSKKTILISVEDYNNAVSSLLILKRNYWLPKQIKVKMEFLDIFGISEVENQNDETFVKLFFNLKTPEIWGKPLPELTFEEFNKNLIDLVSEIENWLKIHSDIPLDLKFEEAHK